MNVLHIELHHHSAAFTGPDASYTVPLGSSSLADMIASDPPLPEELTNAIGIFMDHLEDVTREVPSATFADAVTIAGPGLQSLVDTEVGHPQGLPFDLARDAVEEVYRTVATETAAERAHNPGLPLDEVHHILGVCCAAVAVLRALQIPQLTVKAG
jgi:exopolyphosphatase/pppGpp-phosphohydrolase